MTDKKTVKLKIKKKLTVEKAISTDFIKLDSFLKLCDEVQSGGHAKIIIQDGEIKVNSEVFTQRGRKLHKGDTVETHNTIYKIV